MIGGIRNASLAASLVVAAPVVAEPLHDGQYVYVPTGVTVVLVPAEANLAGRVFCRMDDRAAGGH
jgi:hypothetical protein